MRHKGPCSLQRLGGDTIDEETQGELEALIGETVIVAVSTAGIGRNGFWTQMSIIGSLEGQAGHTNFRVLTNDSTYCYFTTEDCYLVNPLVSTAPVIHLRIDTPDDC